MDREELIKKIISKKEFSDLPKEDVNLIFNQFDKDIYSDDEKLKKTRDLLRKVYSVFTSKKLLNPKNKDAEWFLKKHISTRERFDFYHELYDKIFRNFKEKEINVLDFGAGINGLSYRFFPKIKDINYIGVEAVGQLTELMNSYFKREKLKNAHALKVSLFNLEEVENLIKKVKGNKIVFLFKVVDSLEMVRKNYSKEFLETVVPLVDEVIVSFATRSLVSRKKFNVRRYWFENFVKENFEVLDDFNIGTERYIVFKKR